jgi:argininosuccinate synthase
MTRPRIVLAFSGGLGSVCAVPWLAEQYGAEIVAIALDLGQGREHGELEDVRDRALAAGAVRAHVLDAREELAREFVVRAIKGDASAADDRPLVNALARPVLARRLAEIAAIEQAASVAHGAAAARDARRLDAAVGAIAPALTVLAPAGEWGMDRAGLAAYARARGLATLVSQDPAYGVDATLWGRTVQAPDPSAAAGTPDRVYTLTAAPADCPHEPAYVDVAFERGAPAAVNGIDMPLTDLVATVAMIAGTHGVGRIGPVPSAAGGATRELCEAPAAHVLHAAHAALQTLAIGARAARFSRRVSREYAELVDAGLWFTPLRDALDAYVDRLQECVTGTIRVKLFRGDCRIVARRLVEPRPSTRRLRVVAARTH